MEQPRGCSKCRKIIVVNFADIVFADIKPAFPQRPSDVIRIDITAKIDRMTVYNGVPDFTDDRALTRSVGPGKDSQTQRFPFSAGIQD